MKQILAIAALLALAACGKKEEEKAPAPVVEVKVAAAETGEVESGITAPATIFPREQANIAARTTSPIRQLLARKGDNVAAGQQLGMLESRDISAQRDEAVAAVSEAQVTLQKTTSGTLPADVERARGALIAAEAAYNQARTVLERRKQLFQQGAIPQRDLLVSETELATTKANYDVAKTSLDLLQNQSRDRDIRIAQDRVAQAQARLKNIDAQMIYTSITAPFSGTITEQFMYAGDMAKPDAPIFTLMDLSTVIARAQVPDAELSSLHIGQACTFGNGAASYPGRISVVNRAVDLARRTVEVWCEIPRPPVALRSGLFGQVMVPLRKTTAVLVPREAVQVNEGTKTGWVMVVEGKNAHKREVEIGEAANDRVAVLKGLKSGESVVVEGVYGLADGVAVKEEK